MLEVENLKLDILTNLQPLEIVNADIVTSLVSSNKKTPANFKKLVIKHKISPSDMSMDNYKKRIVGMYVEHFYNTK